MERAGTRRLAGRVMIAAVLAAVMACLNVASSSAGTITPTGWTESNGLLTYLLIKPDPYGNPWWTIQIKEQLPTTLGAGYTDVTGSFDPMYPGTCQMPDKSDWDCGLLGGSSGEPFWVTGTEGDDTFRELGCTGNAAWVPVGTPCPRLFKINLGGGKDIVRLLPYAPMHGVEINSGPGNDNVIVALEGPSDGRIDAGEGDDYVDTSIAGGPWLIICGPGYDTVNAGPSDQISSDCEARGTGSEVERPSTIAPPVDTDYSLAGICGLKKRTKTPRCYLMLGAGLIRAIKNNEDQIMSSVQSVAARATARIVEDVVKKQIKKAARNQVLAYSVKQVAGELEGKAAGAALNGFSFGQMLGKATTIAIIANRWRHLESKGYPHKCFMFELTYEKKKPKLALDPIFSFVRGWDYANPPSYRGITTSAAHWPRSARNTSVLPLFCAGADAKAETLGYSTGQDELFSKPVVHFSIAYDAR